MNELIKFFVFFFKKTLISIEEQFRIFTFVKAIARSSLVQPLKQLPLSLTIEQRVSIG